MNDNSDPLFDRYAELDFSDAKPVRSIPALARLQAEHGGKSRVTIRLDNEVLAIFKARAEMTGGVELFLVAMRAGEPVGARHHFATLPPGSLLLGTDAAALGLDMALLAVGPIGTELLECPRPDIEARIAPGESATDGS